MSDPSGATPAPVFADPPEVIVQFLAPIFFGVIFNWILLGILTNQLYLYYTRFSRDALWMKCLVYITYMLDLAQTGMTTHLAYTYLVARWGNFNPTNFVVLPSTSIAFPLWGGIIAGVCQGFFCWRVWILGNSPVFKAISVVISLVALLQATCAIAGSALWLKIDSLEKVHQLTTFVRIWLAGSFVADTLIAVTMIWILQKARSATTFRQTNDLISKVLRQTVQTGLITSIAALMDLILFEKFPNNVYHFVPTYIIGKLYTNSLMASLNSRRDHHEVNGNESTRLNTSRGDSVPMNAMSGKYKPKASQAHSGVHVETTLVSRVDDLSSHDDDRDYRAKGYPV